MSLAGQEHIFASLIWLAIIFGPPLALVLLTPMFYADGMSRIYNSRVAHLDGRALLILLIIGLSVWILLLKYLYLPLVGFDTGFLSFSGFNHYDYTDLSALHSLGNQTLDWIGRAPVSAIALLAFPLLLGVAVLLIARAQGRAASLPAPAHPHSR